MKKIFYQKPGIYKIINLINNKVYIGSSINISVRITSHKHCLCKQKHVNSYLQRAFNKYGKHNFAFEVVEYCQENKLLFREEYWINYYKSNNSDFGYNLESFTIGRKRHSEESKKKISASNMGRKGAPRNDNQKEIIRQIGLRPKSEEHKKKISQSKIGVKRKKFSDEWIQNMTKARTKIFCDIYDLNQNIIKENIPVIEVSSFCQVTTTSILTCLQKKYKVKDYWVTFHSENIEIYVNRKRDISKMKRKKVLVKKEEINMEFESIKECAKFLNVCDSCISQSLRKGYLTKGFTISYG